MDNTFCMKLQGSMVLQPDFWNMAALSSHPILHIFCLLICLFLSFNVCSINGTSGVPQVSILGPFLFLIQVEYYVMLKFSKML